MEGGPVKARIRKHDNGKWRVEIPGYGFHASTTVQCDDWQGAIKVTDYLASVGRKRTEPVVNGNFVDLDRAPQPLYSQVFIG